MSYNFQCLHHARMCPLPKEPVQVTYEYEGRGENGLLLELHDDRVALEVPHLVRDCVHLIGVATANRDFIYFFYLHFLESKITVL